MTPDPPILGLAFLLGRCTEEWKGPWSDDSKEWTDEAKEKFDLKVKDDAGPKIYIPVFRDGKTMGKRTCQIWTLARQKNIWIRDDESALTK